MAITVRTAIFPRRAAPPPAKALATGALALTLLLPTGLLAQEDAEDKAYLEKRLSKILEFERTGAEIPWTNPKTGNSGNIQLKRTYFLDPDTPCRDYLRSIDSAEGEPETIRGTGCREATGGWKLTEDAKPKRTVKRGSKKTKTAAATPGAGAPSAKAPAGADGAPAKPDGAKAAPDAKAAAAKTAAAAPKKAAPKAPPPTPKISARMPSPPPEWEATRDNAY